jgi:lipoate-protein ligase A
MKWRLILDNETLPKLNLAREEAIFQARQQAISRDTLRLWRNSKSVIVGCFGHPESEVNLYECERRSVQVVRRTSGGGAVYHDLGNLNFSAIFNASTFQNLDILRIYETFSNAVIVGLSTVGVKAEFHAPNSILLNGDKISGLAIHKTFGACLVHGTLLVDVDLETLHQVLRNIKDNVSNLSDTYPNLTVDDVSMGIIRGFRSALGINLESEELTDNEIQKTDKLLRLKYGNDLWNLRVPSS